MVKRTGRKSRTTRRGSKRTTRATSRSRTRNVRQQSKGRSKATRRTYGRKRKRNTKRNKKRGGGTNVGHDVKEDARLHQPITAVDVPWLRNKLIIEGDTTVQWKSPTRELTGNGGVRPTDFFDTPNGKWIIDQLNSDKNIKEIKTILLKTGNLIKADERRSWH